MKTIANYKKELLAKYDFLGTDVLDDISEIIEQATMEIVPEVLNNGTNLVQMKKVEGVFSDPTELVVSGHNDCVKSIIAKRAELLGERK